MTMCLTSLYNVSNMAHCVCKLENKSPKKEHPTNTLDDVCSAAGGGIRKRHVTMRHIRFKKKYQMKMFCFRIVSGK